MSTINEFARDNYGELSWDEKLDDSLDTNASIDDYSITEEFDKELKEYNAGLHNLDEDYKALKPLSKILLRVFCKTSYKTKEGTLVMPDVNIPVATQSGYGSHHFIQSPYPYANKAVVVSVPKGYETLKPGDIVGLERSPIHAEAVGRGSDAHVVIRGAFVHPDSNLTSLPIDPRDKHYGYILVDYFEINMILNGN
jgi:hypothetical protein